MVMENNFPILFAFLLFIFMVLKIGKRRTKKDSPNLAPGPWKLPLIGNIHNIIGSLPHHGLCNLAKKYGPLMHIQLGEVSAIVVSAPETAEMVLKTHGTIFANRPHVLSAHITTYGSKDIAFAPYGGYWRQLRKICTTELLNAKRVKSFQSIREEEVLNLIKSISLDSSSGSPVNLSQKIFSLTYGVTARAAFGGKCKDQEAFISCIKEGVKLAGGFGSADVFPSIKLLPVISGMKRKIEKLHQDTDRILESIIHEHRANYKTDLKKDESVADDLLDVLLNLQEHADLEFPLAMDNIKALILDVFSAGSETSSTSMEWAMSEMLKNPRVMDKAQSEVRQVFSTKGSVDEAGLQDLTFLKMVIKETMRLHPPAPLLIPRESREKCEINGYDIPHKTKVIVNAWAIGRDPRYWTEPDRFYPERFVDSSMDYKGTNFAFIPFGAGRRICPGILFALPNIELPLANFLYHFDWKLPCGIKQEDLDMTETFGVTVRRKRDLFLIPIPYHPLPVE